MNIKMTNAARMLMSSVAAETDASGPGGGPPELPTASVHLTQKHFAMPEFFMSEDLGVSPVKSCVKCKSCLDCDYRTTAITREEAAIMEKQRV